jgi:Raf kinase inhibitor-like YbhB/YbcL family protein
MIATNCFSQRLVLIGIPIALFGLASCTSQEEIGQETGGRNTARAPVSSSNRSPKGVPMMKSATQGIAITSTAFGSGQPIPTKYTEDGQDVSPPLAWSDAPTGTKQWALICDDPDAPTNEWVHWVIYGLPASTRSLPEGVKTSAQLSEPKGTLQGKNSWPKGRTVGYRGPAPPKGHGLHHYHFKLYALDSASKLSPGLTKSDLLKAIDGHILGVGELVGTYERK